MRTHASQKPRPTAVMVFTLALAIGATTAIFSVVYGVLLRPLPFTDANRIMAVFEVNSTGGWSHLADRASTIFAIKNRSFQAIAKYNYYAVSVSGTSQPSRTTVGHVSPDFLKVFGIQPILGRDFTAGDAKKGAGPTVLVSYGYWKQYLGSPLDLSQSNLKIDARPTRYRRAPGRVSIPARRGPVAAGRLGRRKSEQDGTQLLCGRTPP